MDKLMAAVGWLAVAFLGPVWGGFVLVQLWAWFVTPTFGLPHLKIPVAIGLSLVFGVLQPSRGKEAKMSPQDALAASFLLPLVCLGIGRIAAAFM